MAESMKPDLVQRVLREFDKAASKRGTWEIQWEEVSRIVLPYYSTSFYSQGNMTPGAKRGYDLFDATANGALWKFAAASESMLTPANNKWHRVRSVDPNLNKIRNVQLWFDAVTDALFHFRYSPHSGFQSNQHDGYVSLGAFGTSALFIDEFRDPARPNLKGLRYRNVHLGELFFAANHQGQIDTVYRRFKMTLRQIIQKWGEDALPDGLAMKLKNDPELEVQVVHAVFPRDDFEPGRLDERGLPYASVYILREQRHLLHEGGYRCMPYAVARYLTAPGELYGRGPAMNVLPSIKVLNQEKKTLLKQGQRAVDPVLLAYDDGILSQFNLTPGAINFGGVSAEGRPLVQALAAGNVQIGKELLDDERLTINDAFLVTLFQILVDTPQMTATEVLERAREKGALLSPTMGRFQSESLGPMIEREFDLLMHQGLIPPPPPEVVEAGVGYVIEYDAPLNRAMRSDEAAGTMRTFQWAAEIAAQTQDPSVMDFFDTDTIIPELMEINGAPYRFMRTPDQVAALRQQRQQAQAAQQVTQALPGMAAMMKASAPEGTSPNEGQPQ